MIAMLLSLPGYLLYMVLMAAVPYMVYRGAMSAFSVLKDGELGVASITIFLVVALKNWVWLALISELFPSHLRSTVSGMIAALVGLAGYLVCMMGLTVLVLLAAIHVCAVACRTHPNEFPDWVDMVIFGVAVMVMDVFMKHSSHSTMMVILLFLASCLVRVACVAGLPYMVFKALSDAFPSLMDDECGVIVVWIAIFLPLALNNFPIFTLVSKFPSHLPSSVYEMIAALLGLAGYIACMTGLSILVLAITIFACDAALQPDPGVKPPWMLMIVLGFTATVMDMFMNDSTHSNMMVMFLFAVYLVYIICVMGLSYLVFENLVFEDITVDVLPFLLPVQLNYRKPPPIIVSGVILVLNDLHGVTGPLQKPAFISELLSIVPFSVSGTLPGYLIDILCMVALSFLVLVIAVGAVLQTWTRRPMGRPELMLTTIVGLTFVLLNLMWGTPFQKPSNSDASTKATLVCLAGYLLYILCSIALSGKLCESKMDALVISLTFVLLHMFSVSDMIDALVGLVWMIAKALLTLLFLAPLLFLVCAGVYTWLSILLPSSGSSYKELTFASIVGVSFRLMQAMLDTPALLGTADLVIKYLTVFSDMKAMILGVAESINNYQTAYTVISYLAAFVYIEITRNITSAN